MSLFPKGEALFVGKQSILPSAPDQFRALKQPGFGTPPSGCLTEGSGLPLKGARSLWDEAKDLHPGVWLVLPPDDHGVRLAQRGEKATHASLRRWNQVEGIKLECWGQGYHTKSTHNRRRV